MGSELLSKIPQLPEALMQRSLGGGMVLAALFFFMWSEPSESITGSDLLILIFAFPLAMLLAYVSYEMFMPVLEWASRSIILRGFRRATKGEGDSGSFDIEDLRMWRISFLNSSPTSYAATLILEHLRLQKTIRYLLSSLIMGLILSTFALVFWDERTKIALGEMLVCVTMLGPTYVAFLCRSYSIGRSQGFAYRLMSDSGPAGSAGKRPEANERKGVLPGAVPLGENGTHN